MATDSKLTAVRVCLTGGSSLYTPSFCRYIATYPSSFAQLTVIPEASRGLAAFRIGSQSILFGAEGYFCDSLECVRFIRGPVRKKAVFKAKWNGLRAITKWWSDESHARFVRCPDSMSHNANCLLLSQLCY